MNERKTVEIPTTVHREFKVEAALRGVMLKDAVEQAIRLWIKSKPVRAKKELQAA